MFTGIIEEVGTIERVTGGAQGGRVLVIRSGFAPESIGLGDSIAINGVCLTVTQKDGARFWVDAGPETLERTTTGALASGAKVNLERAMAVGDRLGGHIVSGHVDGVGEVRTVDARDNAWDIGVEAPHALMPLVAARGSITIDGISLTVTKTEGDVFYVSIIPHTWKETTLAQRSPGSRVNLEVDLIARYVARLLEQREAPATGLTMERLESLGYGRGSGND